MPRVGGVTRVTCWLGYASRKRAQPMGDCALCQSGHSTGGLGGWEMTGRGVNDANRVLFPQKESAAGAPTALHGARKAIIGQPTDRGSMSN